jgi:hypothetical protein
VTVGINVVGWDDDGVVTLGVDVVGGDVVLMKKD